MAQIITVVPKMFQIRSERELQVRWSVCSVVNNYLLTCIPLVCKQISCFLISFAFAQWNILQQYLPFLSRSDLATSAYQGFLINKRKMPATVVSTISLTFTFFKVVFHSSIIIKMICSLILCGKHWAGTVACHLWPAVGNHEGLVVFLEYVKRSVAIWWQSIIDHLFTVWLMTPLKACGEQNILQQNLSRSKPI